jgi:two-component system, LuxR family, sensor kinase FixL
MDDKQTTDPVNNPKISKRSIEKRLIFLEKRIAKIKSTLSAQMEERERLLQTRTALLKQSEEGQQVEESRLTGSEEGVQTMKPAWAEDFWYRELIENLHEGVWLVDEEGIILYSNPQMAKILGYEINEIRGRSVYDFMEEVTASEARRDYEKRRKGESGLYERQYVRKDGGRLYALVAASPLFDQEGKFKGSLAGILDITTRKKTEADLKIYAERLEQSNKDLEEFAYIASHDMKEPLRKIKSFGENLQKQAALKLDEGELDYLERMIQAAERMQEMIDGLLELALVSSEGKPFTEVDLNLVLEDVLDKLSVLIEERDARVEVSHLPTIKADIFQMQQLFHNLVWNAIKFVDERKKPVIRVMEYKEEGKAAREISVSKMTRDYIQVAVQDNGIGFPKEEADRIFLPFQRAHGKYKFEGSGIGLAICRKIVEHHGGQISIKSTPGEGSTFIIRFPSY